MDKKIIDLHRYKKISRSKLKKKSKIKQNKKYYKENKSKNNINKKNGYSDNKYLKTRKNSNVLNKFFKVAVFCFVLVTVAVLSKSLIYDNNNKYLVSVLSDKDEKVDEELESNYSFNIGISKLDTTDYLKSNNLVLNELAIKSKLSLVKINSDYKVEYYLAEKIEKLTDLTYKISLNPIYKISSDNVINSYNKIKSVGEENIYYKNLQNIVSMEKIDEVSIKMTLLSHDPYLIYKLNFLVDAENSKMVEYSVGDKTDKSISFVKNNTKSTLGVIKLNSYLNTDDMIVDFRNDKIDMFTASSDNIMQIIGKKEYNVKKYRDGETIFLLGNINSPYFKRKEVRQAIAYSINRDEIVKNVDMKFSEVIDIPYIYSDIKYKYDLYAAQNVLLVEGWKKVGGIYTKHDGYEYNKLELNLLVNEADEYKVKISNYIKEMVEKSGIRINILKLPEGELLEKISLGEYDLVLSTININENPDIEFLYSYINVNDIVNSAIESVKNSDIESIEQNLLNLKDTLSNEVACIGIMAKTTNVVYQKYIKGFETIKYFKIFDNIEGIGKIK